ncbi:hypothetical protein J3E61_006611 [Mycobacterium sp. OAE908]
MTDVGSLTRLTKEGTDVVAAATNDSGRRASGREG